MSRDLQIADAILRHPLGWPFRVIFVHVVGHLLHSKSAWEEMMRPFLFSLDPEVAHQLSIEFVGALGGEDE